MSRILEEVKEALYTSIPLPSCLKFLDTPIPLPGFFESAPRRRARRRAHAKRMEKKPEVAVSVPPQRTSSMAGREAKERAMEGLLVPGKTTRWSLNGYDLMINPDTWMFGELREGAPVKVKGAPFQGNKFLCNSLVVKGPGYTSSTGIPKQ
jgi:hypothetical protein